MRQNYLRKYICTITYIALIVSVNFIFAHMPDMEVSGYPISCADFIVGVVYIMRDFSQREIRNYVLPAMLFGCVLSYFLADKSIAIASVTSFFVGEFIDWGIYSFTRKPLSERLLWSSLISDPIDSVVFLLIIDKLNVFGVMILTFSKVLGVLSVWAYWKKRQRSQLMMVTR